MRVFEGYKNGVNIGGWISQFGTYDEDHFDTFIVESDIKEISEFGFDHVRVPVDYMVLEDEDGNKSEIYCGWQNAYDPESKLCKFYLSLFEQGEDGSFWRSDEEQTERCYSLEEIKATLAGAGMELLGVWADFDFSPEKEDTERWYFAARAIK